MSSEAITQNDLREILSRTVGSVPSEYKKLLWTNPSPTSAFASQALTIDLTNYDAVEIEVNMYTASTGEYHQTFSGRIGTNLLISGMIYQSTMPLSRLCEIRSSSILFNDGYANNTGNNNAVVPLRIYGIKYERVAPPQVDASDYVVEQGTDGIWTYRKWDSGVSECWGTHSVTLTHYATYGGFYGFTTSVTFPQNLFSERPVAVYNCLIDSAFSMSAANLGLTKDGMNLYGLSNVGNTQATVWDIQVKGRWK